MCGEPALGRRCMSKQSTFGGRRHRTFFPISRDWKVTHRPPLRTIDASDPEDADNRARRIIHKRVRSALHPIDLVTRPTSADYQEVRSRLHARTADRLHDLSARQNYATTTAPLCPDSVQRLAFDTRRRILFNLTDIVTATSGNVYDVAGGIERLCEC